MRKMRFIVVVVVVNVVVVVAGIAVVGVEVVTVDVLYISCHTMFTRKMYLELQSLSILLRH
jgi:hypothetical protein